MLRLEVVDFEGPAAWRWRLTDDARGGFLADREVRLDPAAWQFEAFTDLDDYVRLHAAPDRRFESEAKLVRDVGDWIGQEVLGEVGQALVAHAPVTVRVELPAGAEVLAYRPLELGSVGGEPLAKRDISLVFELAEGRSRALRPVGERLRMLAAFSLPVDATALNLRRERVELARLIHTIAATNGKAVELEVVQYGVTRERLEDLMLEDEGWDVVHISGHGLPEGLLLEHADGSHDKISTGDLARLLERAASQLKLVVLSSCESAALTATEHLRLLGIAPASSLEGADERDGGSEPLPAMAAALAGELDCAVLAMRFPVADEFAIALARRLYDLILGKGQPLPRALGLTLPRVLSDPGMAGVPAISVATPALFGARAAELRLRLPAGEPAVFDRERQKLDMFPPQPERFVGRVAALSNATAALAPASGRSGVLFHGMAGGGKTACALELAYTHEQSFGRLVWHKAPNEDEDLAPAFTRFALDLEAQIPGLQMIHLVEDLEALRGFLPTLAGFLRAQRLLIVIDNCESLLTAAGDWRDERWNLAIEALGGHGGLSRLVLTSRTRPRTLPKGMLIESVHALSIHEAVLLAREWPHLRALLEGRSPDLDADEARELATRTLAMVQGHPKLIELAEGQAADPENLRSRLEEADRAWLGAGVEPRGFLERGRSTGSDVDYLRVLDHWTRATSNTVPDAGKLLFHVLCCIEAPDRVEPAVSVTWARIWERFGGSAELPTVESALEELIGHALVAVERDDAGDAAVYHLHPAVAATGLADAGAELQAVVDNGLGAYWIALLREARQREGEQLGWLVLRAAHGALPYLARQRHWNEFATSASDILARDDSVRTAAGLLPLLRQAATAVKGTEHDLAIGRVTGRALENLRTSEAEAEYRKLLKQADARGQHDLAGILAGDLIRLLRDAGRSEEALALVDEMEDHDRRAGLGPWTQLINRGVRLQLLASMGHSEEVLSEVNVLRTRIAELPEASEQRETATPFNVRELILDIGRTAARDLGRWEEALALNAEQLDSLRRRDAAAHDMAFSAFNDYGPLLRLGRVEEARALLLRCRAAFTEVQDIGMLGATMSALADVEDALGRGDRALLLEADALRLGYSDGQPEGISISHFNLSSYLLKQGGDQRETRAHRLAAAVINYQTNSGELAGTIWQLAMDTRELPVSPELEWQELCDLVGRTDGVKLAELVARLPARAAGGPAALAEALRLAAEVPVDAMDESHLRAWEPVIAALVAARKGDPDAVTVLDEALTARGRHNDWKALVDVLRRLAAGEDRTDLLVGLDAIDTAIVRRALDALTGEAQIDANAWRALSTADDGAEQSINEQLAELAGAIVAAAEGDEHATALVQPVLDEMSAQDEWANLAGVLRRIVVGERDPALVRGLDDTDASVVEAILTALAEESERPDARRRS